MLLTGDDIPRAKQMIDNPPLNFNVLNRWLSEATNTDLQGAIQYRIRYLEDKTNDNDKDYLTELNQDLRETEGLT